MAHHPRDIVRCSCGREGYRMSILAHVSQSKRKRLATCDGTLTVVAEAPIEAPPQATVSTQEPARVVAAVGAAEDAEGAGEDPFPQSWVYPAGYGEVDERDRVARALLAEETGGGGRPPSANGSGAPPQEISPDGLYQEPTAPVSPSTTPISVALPVDIKIMYDWYKAQGWNLDDGSIGAWVYDMVSTHFRECMGLEIYVGRKVEVMQSG